jgi:outer membrane protein assembly factor BamD
MHRFSWRAGVALLVCVSACRPVFKLSNYPTREGLYEASLRAYERHKWDNAVSGFEQLTLDLPTRDTLLPRSYWYLAKSHQGAGDHVLAAQAFTRVFESFPEDSLAARSALLAAREYAELWKRPDRDPSYGETALAAYSSAITFYSTKPEADTAKIEYGQIEDRFARKDYDNGVYYMRMKFFDSANIYFNDVLRKYPNTATARLAALRLVDSYRAIKYLADADDMCGQLRSRFPEDAEVKRSCPTTTPPAAPTRDTTTAPRVERAR